MRFNLLEIDFGKPFIFTLFGFETVGYESALFEIFVDDEVIEVSVLWLPFKRFWRKK